MKILSRIWLVLIFSISTASQASPTVAAQEDWLWNKQIELYQYLLRFSNVAQPERAKLQEGLHRFAFEYWMLVRNSPSLTSPVRRMQLRNMIHNEGKNDSYFDDPALLTPFFKNDHFEPNIAAAPVLGLELDRHLTKAKYQELVRGFQATFFNFTNIYPVNPIPTNSVLRSVIETDPTIGKFLEKRRWPMLTRDKLPISYNNDLIGFYNLLTPDGKLYYLPAFLTICERNHESIGNFPVELITFLSEDAEDSKAMISKLTKAQKNSIVAFFNDFFINKTDMRPLCNKLALKLN